VIPWNVYVQGGPLTRERMVRIEKVQRGCCSADVAGCCRSTNVPVSDWQQDEDVAAFRRTNAINTYAEGDFAVDIDQLVATLRGDDLTKSPPDREPYAVGPIRVFVSGLPDYTMPASNPEFKDNSN
jgi:hypothetical protein